MAKLIERIGTETKVDEKPIDLSTLVSAGCEIIHVESGENFYSGQFREKVAREAKSKALADAAGLADSTWRRLFYSWAYASSYYTGRVCSFRLLLHCFFF